MPPFTLGGSSCPEGAPSLHRKPGVLRDGNHSHLAAQAPDPGFPLLPPWLVHQRACPNVQGSISSAPPWSSTAFCRWDLCSCLLVGLPASTLASYARGIPLEPQTDPVPPLLRTLHGSHCSQSRCQSTYSYPQGSGGSPHPLPPPSPL